MEEFTVVVWVSVGVSWLLFLIMFGLLEVMGLYDSDFFSFHRNPTVLNHQLTETWHVVVFVVFFFLNSFANQWNGVVIDPIFGSMLVNDQADAGNTGVKKSRLFPLLAVYQVWGSAQWFFGLLGVTSHVGFMLATISGSLCGGLLTRWLFLQPKYRPYLRHIRPCKLLPHSAVHEKRIELTEDPTHRLLRGPTKTRARFLGQSSKPIQPSHLPSEPLL